jgi:hypothetical protein
MIARTLRRIYVGIIYRVIFSVLEPRKCEYVKDYLLDFEHPVYDYIPCFMRSMSKLEEMLEMFIYSSHIGMFKI